MKKLLGYIPVEEGESIQEIHKTTSTVIIEGQTFKLAEVWIPGVAVGMDFGTLPKTELIYGQWKPKEFEALERQRARGLLRVCKNCGKTQKDHEHLKNCPV